MGTFFSLVAVRSNDSKDVMDAALAYVRSHGWRVTTVEPAEYDDWILQHPSHSGWSFLEFKWSSLDWVALARTLSCNREAPVFFFFIYDGDVWGYHFFDGGQFIGKFVSCPSSFPDTEDTPGQRVREEWHGAIAEIGRRMELKDAERKLMPYVQHLHNPDASYGKAYTEDEHALEDPWVVADFMFRLGIPFPTGDQTVTYYLRPR